MSEMITAFDEIREVEATMECVEALAKRLGVRLGDMNKPLKQMRYAARQYMPISVKDREIVNAAFDFLYLAWLEYS